MGSEMCIRDRSSRVASSVEQSPVAKRGVREGGEAAVSATKRFQAVTFQDVLPTPPTSSPTADEKVSNEGQVGSNDITSRGKPNSTRIGQSETDVDEHSATPTSTCVSPETRRFADQQTLIHEDDTSVQVIHTRVDEISPPKKRRRDDTMAEIPRKRKCLPPSIQQATDLTTSARAISPRRTTCPNSSNHQSVKNPGTLSLIHI